MLPGFVIANKNEEKKNFIHFFSKNIWEFFLFSGFSYVLVMIHNQKYAFIMLVIMGIT